MSPARWFAILITLAACSTPSVTAPGSHTSATVAPSRSESQPYRRFEQMESPETLAWVEARNRESREVLDGLPSRPYFQEGISKHLRINQLGLPWKTRAGLHYYTRKLPGQNHGQLVRSRKYGDRQSEEVVLDPDQWSSDGSKTMSGWVLSHDERLIVYGTSTGGSDWTTWRVLDTSSGELRSDELRGLKWSAPSWTSDDLGFFYSGYDNRSHQESAGGKGNRIYYHRLGTAQEDDPVVYRPKSEEWMANPAVSEAGDFVVVYVYKSSDGVGRIELYPLPGKLPEDPTSLFSGEAPHVLSPDFAYRQWDVGTDPGVVYLYSQRDAPTGRVDRYTLATRTLETIVPARKETLTSLSRAGGFLFAEYLEHVRSFVIVYDLSGKAVDEIRLPFPGNVWGFGGRSWHREAFFGSEGHVQPFQVNRYDLDTKQTSRAWQLQLDFNSDEYVVNQVFYDSADGTKVPMFVVHRRDRDPSGKAPALLTAWVLRGADTHSVRRVPYSVARARRGPRDRQRARRGRLR